MFQRKPLKLHHPALLILLALCSFAGAAFSGLTIRSLHFHAAGDESVPPPAPHMRILPKPEPQEITVDVEYRGWGGTMLEVTPLTCLSGGYRLNGVSHPFPYQLKKACQALILDLSGQLHTGSNTLILNTTDNPFTVDGVSIGAPLFGAGLMQSACTLICAASLLALLWLWLARHGFDRPTCALLLSACAMYLYWLHLTPDFVNFFYDCDLPGHVEYIQYASTHFGRIYGYMGNESWQPFPYYWLCALAGRAASALGLDPWLGIRLVSVVSYMAFIVVASRTFALCLHGHMRWLAVAMLALWPSGLYHASRVNNDLLYYPFYAATFYYSLLWHGRPETRFLRNALACCGLAFAVKSSAFVPAAILAATVMHHLARRTISPRSLISRDVLNGAAVLAAGVALNTGKLAYQWLVLRKNLFPYYLGGEVKAYYPAFAGTKQFGFFPHGSDFFRLNMADFLAHPLNPLSDMTIWDFQMKTLLFDFYPWQHTFIASVIALLWMAVLAFLLLSMARHRDLMTRWFPVFCGCLLPVMASVLYVLLYHDIWCLEFRYIKPALAALLLMLLLPVQEAGGKDRLYAITGKVLAMGLGATCALFMLWQL